MCVLQLLRLHLTTPGSNVLILCFSLFLINSGQSWVAARKYILYGLLIDKKGDPVGPDSDEFANLKVGVMIGGPFEDVSGPALNNFIKFVGVFAFVTEGMYDPTPERTWPYGFACIFASLVLVAASKWGLSLGLSCVTSFLKQRQLQREKLEARHVQEEDAYDEDALEDDEDMPAITAG
ncbi:unnamed protein product [Polarella glacialis]|uniref:H(+)-exporting diphosphatase n=1 Tax=Polarella glacialis TaxID=89957 RepID=A0A813DE29_POLGL|nr:unnamed protein product [Polarella glacialis]